MWQVISEDDFDVETIYLHVERNGSKTFVVHENSTINNTLIHC